MGSTESLNGREKSQELLLVLDFSSRHFFFRPFFRRFLASEKSRFSSLFAAGDVLSEGTSATQRQLHSTKISGNFGPKLKGWVRSNQKSFEKTGPFSRSDGSEFWLNGSRPLTDDVKSVRISGQNDGLVDGVVTLF